MTDRDDEQDEASSTDASAERAGIQRILRSLGATLGFDDEAVEELIAVTAPSYKLLADASADMAHVVDALGRLGRTAREEDRDFESTDLMTNLLSGEPYVGSGTEIDACEDPDDYREAFARGIVAATSQDESLLVWNLGDRVEVWETSPVRRPIVHAGVLAWLTKRAAEVRPVD
jgi:hypothetical protein